MDPSWPTPMIWDATMALRDVCLEMHAHHSQGEGADAETLKRWHEWIHKAHRAHNALVDTCEDLVEEGASPERLEAMKQALTHAMGQIEYWRREDRW